MAPCLIVGTSYDSLDNAIPSVPRDSWSPPGLLGPAGPRHSWVQRPWYHGLLASTNVRHNFANSPSKTSTAHTIPKELSHLKRKSDKLTIFTNFFEGDKIFYKSKANSDIDGKNKADIWEFFMKKLCRNYEETRTNFLCHIFSIKKDVNRDSHIASLPISQSWFFEEVRCLILASWIHRVFKIWCHGKKNEKKFKFV